jgi:hypothetical protein
MTAKISLQKLLDQYLAGKFCEGIRCRDCPIHEQVHGDIGCTTILEQLQARIKLGELFE